MSMDRLLIFMGGATALLAGLVLADNVRALRSTDEMPIIAAWVGGWIIAGPGAVVGVMRQKG
jgi:hypothetical protein